MAENENSTQQTEQQSVSVDTGKDHDTFISTVFDYAFERDGDYVNLAFSVRDPQPEALYVRLYECCITADPVQRRQYIKLHAVSHGDEPGCVKSGQYYTVADGDTMQEIAQKFGHKDWKDIYNHPLNSMFRMARPDPTSLEAGDEIFVPQLDIRDVALPLGDLISTDAVDESVPNGKRYQARWDIEQTGYNPLDWRGWLPEVKIGMFFNREASSNPKEYGGQVSYRPQFAVLTGPGKVIGISPTPLELVRETQIETEEDSPEFGVILGDGTARELGSGTTSETFSDADEPLTFL
ncbi:MAG: LysM peptidoglycan-binding domain-containing protein [Candidatus Zixiibacteriota bacterium]|nr:MAG: LysM peptidoglycan-binding domain-containing protein [candidate division Zixibacteria bacterium]